jgi:tetratricopeptide (TPR) repeat protein
VWRHSIGGLIAAPFGALYDGGDVPPEPKPQYSVALARRKQGMAREAIGIIQHQLELFPADMEGQILMADIQANDLKELPAAEETIQRFVAQSGHAPANIAFALYSIADWHLAVAKDRESARRCLEQIVQTLPQTEFALGASNRIAHLGTEETILATRRDKGFVVKASPRNLGLIEKHDEFLPKSENPGEVAAQYVKHLEEHPFDTEAREKLAIIYCDHFHRLDLAEGELERMISEPQQPARMVVHWLNLLADLQVRSGATYETARQTLERIIERGPSLAAAQVAQNRIERLRIEIKSQQKSQAVKLGSYEQNIGLKQGSNR